MKTTNPPAEPIRTTVRWLREMASGYAELAERLERLCAPAAPEARPPSPRHEPRAAKRSGNGRSPANPDRGQRNRLRAWLIRAGRGAQVSVGQVAAALGLTMKQAGTQMAALARAGELQHAGRGLYHVGKVPVPQTTEGYEAQKHALGIDGETAPPA